MLSNFKNKRKKNFWGYVLKPLTGVVIIFILVFLIVANIRIYRTRQEYLAQISTLQNRIKDIQNRNNNLKEGISQANNDQYIEKVAREQLDLQKPGEKTVSFIMPPTENQQVNNQQKNNWQSWFSNVWNWILGK